MTRAIANELKRIACQGEPQTGSLLRRAFRHFLPRRSEIEQVAARNRVERLFEVNFRNSWNR
jgi:hypothetical protein